MEGLKEVVRKKLGVSVSTSVHLAQLRDGKAVDLEDGGCTLKSRQFCILIGTDHRR